MSELDHIPSYRECKDCHVTYPLTAAFFLKDEGYKYGFLPCCRRCSSLRRGRDPRIIFNLTQLPLFDPIFIPLTQGQQAVIDPTDADLMAFHWHAAKDRQTFYARRHNSSDGRKIFMHNDVWERMTAKPIDPDERVDHINLNGLDNRRSNLRIATVQQNNRNRRRQRNSKSGYKGVTYNKDSRNWRAVITIDKHNIHLGYFDTPEEAYAVYCAAAKAYFGEFARLE